MLLAPFGAQFSESSKFRQKLRGTSLTCSKVERSFASLLKNVARIFYGLEESGRINRAGQSRVRVEIRDPEGGRGRTISNMNLACNVLRPVAPVSVLVSK